MPDATNISTLRTKFPQYHDMSDAQLGEAVRQKYYADMPEDQYWAKIGVKKPTPPRKPYNERVGEAFDTVAKDATENPLSVAGQVLDPLAGPIRYGMKVGGDVFNLGMALTGAGAVGEHVERKAEAHGVTPTPFKENFLERALSGLNTGQGLGTALYNQAASKKTPEERAKAFGDLTELIASIQGPDAIGGLLDARKIGQIAKEFGVPRSVAEAMLKQGIKRTKTVSGEPSLVQRAKNVGGQVVKAVKGQDLDAPITAEQRAAGEKIGQRVVGQLVKKRDPTGERLTANPAEAMGKPTTTAEALGPTGEGRLGSVARREGATGDALKGQLGARMREAPLRIQDDFERASGASLPELEGDFRTANREARAAHGPEYAKVNPQVVPNSEELTTILKRPVVEDALREAVQLVKNDDVNPEHIGLIVSNTKTVYRNAQGELEVGLHTEPIEVRHPTIQTLDYLRRGLQEQLEKFRDPITKKLNLQGPKAVQIVRSLDELRDLMFKASPEYEALMAKVGDPIKQGEAFEDAPRLFGSKVNEFKFNERVNGRLNAKTGKRTGGMSDPEKRALLSGALNDVYSRLRNTGLNVKQVLTPAYRAKLEALVGKAKAAELFTRLEEEARGGEAAGRMYPTKGSGTFGWTAGAHETDQDIETAKGVVKHLPHAVMSGGKSIPFAFLSTMAERWSKNLDLMSGPINEAARDEIGKILMMQPSEAAKYLKDLQVDAPTRTRIEKMLGSPAARAQLRRLVGAGAQAQKQGQQNGR